MVEIEVILGAMADRLHVLALIGVWCGLLFGELTELQRKNLIFDKARFGSAGESSAPTGR
ncbi:MAG: hypothetical protein IPM08_08050 [Actinomycetales bacterium]|nr:hypothetical protein [Actinomycetales bacterium]